LFQSRHRRVRQSRELCRERVGSLGASIIVEGVTSAHMEANASQKAGRAFGENEPNIALKGSA